MIVKEQTLLADVIIKCVLENNFSCLNTTKEEKLKRKKSNWVFTLTTYKIIDNDLSAQSDLCYDYEYGFNQSNIIMSSDDNVI